MKDQHTLISGYRDLNQEEIDLMNEIMVKEAEFLTLIIKVNENTAKRSLASDAAREHALKAEPYRWAAIASTDIQTAVMALVRSVAQPQPTEIK